MIDPDSGQEFIFLDMMGDEIESGDAVFLAESYRSTTIINIALVKQVKFFPKTIEIAYLKFSDKQWDNRPSYFRRFPRDSGTVCRNIIKIKEDVSFYINDKRFAKLLVAKIDQDSQQK